MTADENPADLGLARLTEACAQQTERFFEQRESDSRYCFELFRRAISERDQWAWDAVYHQYRPLVTRWVYRHASFHSSSEEAQYFVNRAFEKMWTALDPNRFDRFGNLPAVLRYLQMCVHSSIMDQLRASKPTAELDDRQLGSADPPLDERLARRQRRGELWAWLESRLNNDLERCVLHGCFVLGLKSGEVYEQFRDRFSSVREVYRVKENLLARLRRDKELEAFLGDL